MGDDWKQIIKQENAFARMIKVAEADSRRARPTEATDSTAPRPEDALIREADGSDPRRSLTQAQRIVVARLARGEPLEAVAARTNVHPERIRRWLAIARFNRALLRERATPMKKNQLLGNWDKEENDHVE